MRSASGGAKSFVGGNGPRTLDVALSHCPRMVDLSFFAALFTPTGLVSLIALIVAAVAFAGYLAGERQARLYRRQLKLMSQATEQLTRLAVLEYSGITNLGRSLASALNPTGEPDLLSPEARAAYHALGPEPDRILEEAELVLSQAGRTMGWKYVPGFREK